MSGGVQVNIFLGVDSPGIYCAVLEFCTVINKELAHCLEHSSAVPTFKVPRICNIWDLGRFGLILNYRCMNNFKEINSILGYLINKLCPTFTGNM